MAFDWMGPDRTGSHFKAIIYGGRSLSEETGISFGFEGSGLHLVVIFLLDLDGVGSSSYLFLRFMFDRKEDGMVIRRKGRR